jgi:peptidyl-prolyl cis-trans isomerase D
MLRGLRTASRNWLGKVVMALVVGFLVISFAIWGIGDIFRGFGRSTLAKIGPTEVTVEQFRTLYNERLQQYARQLGRPIGAEQARALGLDRLITGQLVAEILLDERARQLGLAVTDAEVSSHITGDPEFRGPNGQFSRYIFEQKIRNNGFTEARFVADQRRRMVRRQLAGTIATGLNAPKALVEAANRYQNEERSVEYLLVDRAQAGEVPTPSPEELVTYFEQRKSRFRAPESRKLVTVALIPSEFARWIEISDDDLKRAYEERRARYGTAERRQILQIDFPNLEAARDAGERIAKGTSFAEIAKELGKTEKDVDLGMVTKAGLVDRAVAEAAFALKEGEVSAPIQGRFGPVLLQVVKVDPEKVRSFEEVAGELKQELGTARAKAEVQDLYNKIEDARSEGKTLAEAAATLKLEARTFEAVDRSGRDPSGNPISGLPEQQRILASAFNTEIGVERDPLQVQDGYVWFEVAGITPSRERTLDEVKAQVEQRWQEDEIAKRLEAKATEVLDKLKSGSTFAEVAAAFNLKLETETGVKRGRRSGALSSAAVDAVFRTAKDALGKADASQPGEQVVFRVTEIVVPTSDLASEEAKRLIETLDRSISEDMFSEYIARLESEIGVTIDQTALNQVIGGGAADAN